MNQLKQILTVFALALLAANTHITLRGDLSGESDDFGAGHEGFTDNTDISW